MYRRHSALSALSGLALAAIVILALSACSSQAPAAPKPTTAPAAAKPAAAPAPEKATAAPAAAKPTAAPAAKSAVKYPTKPVTIIIPYGPGGGLDLTMRIVAQHMEKTLAQPVVIENREGAGGSVGNGVLYKATPDGYTLGLGGATSLTIMPHTVGVPYDPVKFSFIAQYGDYKNAVLSKSDAPWKTIQEFVAYAKANPGKITNSTAGGFGIQDIGMALLAEKTGGFQYETLPAANAPDANLRVLAGDAHVTLASAAPSLPHIQAGTLRPLAINSAMWPELQKMGVPLTRDLYGYSLDQMMVLMGPPGMPEEVRQRLEDAVKAALDDKEVQAQLDKVGEITIFKNGKDTLKMVESTLNSYGAIVEKLGKKKK